MIPKIIHYCWFGKNKKNDLINKCISSWKRLCPEYQIIEWNEDNFDIESNDFVKEAYNSKKWAFVSDYVRLYALYHCGGIYLDTDVELLKTLDSFLIYKSFSGFESNNFIPCAVMGAEQNNLWIEKLLSYYKDKHFIMKDGALDMTTNLVIITNITKNYFSIKMNNKFQYVDNTIALFPKEYFAPKSPGQKRIKLTKNSVAIHHFDGSWMDGNKKIRDFKMRHSSFLSFLRKIIVFFIGEKNFKRMRNKNK